MVAKVIKNLHFIVKLYGKVWAAAKLLVNLQRFSNDYSMTTKRYIITIMALMLLMPVGAQKITIGTLTTKDGGDYNGEIQSGKPHGKGRTVYKNGNVYEGQRPHSI